MCCPRPLLGATLLLLCLGAWAGSSSAQRPPHVPTEDELRKQMTGVKSDEERGYQQHSVETTQYQLNQGLRWLRELLRSIHVTPARLLLALGVVGTLWTAGKNKRLVRWAVMAGLSYLLGIVGLAAMIFNWPFFN